jgi:undecaprenyl-diphosphatase
LSYKQSLYIGLIQAVAILPGISRSGSTILGGRLMNLKKENALRFAFLMSLPVISAASGYELLSFFKDGESLGMSSWYVIFGCIITFFVSYFTIKFFMKIIKQVPFKYFGIYSMIMGIIVIIIGII